MEDKVMEAGTARLAIFDTYKTGDSLTAEAARQRLILATLAGRAGPGERTRTGMARRIAGDGGRWKNVYSGVFRDMEEVMLPLGLAGEEGRLPLTRGPRAMQEKGVPYYRLTGRGMISAMAVPGTDVASLLAAFQAGEEGAGPHAAALAALAGPCPSLARMILECHVRAFCSGGIDDLLPLDPARSASDILAPYGELIRGVSGMTRGQREAAAAIVDRASGADKH
ncbi:MAG: hypothetical protein MPI95_02195 [Nitrosopumilus sp.]|nr:hypothetical protein [Nitrosopumilus sp.]CAI9831090.1 conserved hypothetical protein [Nitrosopumilaceae archaeon]MDA7941182.1 hypothetical protein [Nitrosopumilus sp.]MDA7942420.1 hypothetical protein [Nitrosopumilus sp.]MDA7944859.1 hypothetical protein [Nitrosopumilus sp.]